MVVLATSVDWVNVCDQQISEWFEYISFWCLLMSKFEWKDMSWVCFSWQ